MYKFESKINVAEPYLKENYKMIEVIDPKGIDTSSTVVFVDNMPLVDNQITQIDDEIIFEGMGDKKFSIGYQVLEDEIKEIGKYTLRTIKKMKLMQIYSISNREYKYNRQQTKKAKVILRKLGEMK